MPAIGRPTDEVLGRDGAQEDWASKRLGDVGWVYVAIYAEPYASEAVTVTVTLVADEYRIREIEWGRP